MELAEHLIQDEAFALKNEPAGSITASVRDLRSEAGELEPAFNSGLQPEVFRTPGYPVFLAAFQWLGLPAHGVLIGQCVLGALCVLLTYQLTFSLLQSSTAGLVAAAIMALHPGAIAMANIMLPDMLWLAMILGGLWLIISSMQQPTASMAIGGLLLGAAALVQPYAVVLLIALAVWVGLRQRTWRSIAPAMVMLIMASVGPGLWMARNHLVGFDAHLSSEPIVDRYFHTIADMRIADADGDMQKDWPATADMLLSELAGERGENESVLAAMDRLTQTDITNRPMLYAQTLKRDTIHFFTDHSLAMLYQQLGISYASPDVQERILTSGLSLSEWTGTSDDVTLLTALAWTTLNALLFVAAIVGLIVLFIRRQWLSAILLVALTGYLLIDLHGEAYERLHVIALGFQAAMIGAIAIPRPHPRRVKVKKSREEKKMEKHRRRQQQTLGVEGDVDDLTHDHDPIIPGTPGISSTGPREHVRPI